MDIGETRFEDVTVLSIVGDFDAHNAPHAHEKLDALIKELRVRLVFNVAGIPIVTSTAIGYLIDAAKRMRRLGGDVVLTGTNRLLLQTMEALQIQEFLKTFASAEEAIAHFRGLGPVENLEDTVKTPKRKLWRLPGWRK
ncbi:MAG: STAS domain-containing protein [Planctomycetota bacterium]|jgi:anti-anti-sigma factor